MPDLHATLAANLARVRERIAAAATSAGRSTDSVRLVAVTKYVEPPVARALFELGQHDLGESRPQELWRKAATFGESSAAPRWHFIGHLQRNKLERTLPLVSLLHSGDSLRLLTAIDEFGQRQGQKAPVLIEVNISGDATKHGFRPDELSALGETLAGLKQLDVRGLMGMSSLEGSLDDARREFDALRRLCERLQREWPAEIQLVELSMGMSDDFEAAIAAGSTCVRIGSALFEGVA